MRLMPTVIATTLMALAGCAGPALMELDDGHAAAAAPRARNVARAVDLGDHDREPHRERGGREPILGDFNRELRTADKRFDTPGMIDHLKRMGCNTYVFQIWHEPTDWEDLPEFAAAAERENISVWVWVMPWSMTPAGGKKRYSEPFRVDYVRWAEEIAKLSLRHKNVVGYMMNDFYVNVEPGRFTSRYVREFVEAGRRVNPKLLFYPVLYFQQAWGEFVEQFGPYADGVLVAFPASETEVEHALHYLNGRAYGPGFGASFPRREPAAEGAYAAITADLRVTDPDDASISFYWNKTSRSDLEGYRFGYVKVEDRIVWESDVAASSPDRPVRLRLTKAARDRKTIRVEMGVEVRRRARFPLAARIDDIRLRGLELPGRGWRVVSDRGRGEGEPIEPSLSPGGAANRKRLPMIVMVAAETEQHEMRYSEPGDARNIARKLRLATGLQEQGLIQGVVTYCAPKDETDPIFRAVRNAYDDVRAATRR